MREEASLEKEVALLVRNIVKRCNKCGHKKLLEQFVKCGQCENGRAGTCKSCDCKRAGEWQQENKEEVAKRRGKYYQENKEKIIERVTKYRQTKRGRTVKAMSDKNRKHRKRAQGGGITLQQWNEILEIYNHRCAYCGIHEVVLNALGETMTMDCIIPLSKGGEYSIENIVPACASCNSSKGAKLDWELRTHAS